MDPHTIVGTLTRKGRRWLVSMHCADDPRPGGFALVRSPSGREAIVILGYRERLTSMFGTELWGFRLLFARPAAAADFDQSAQREVWLRELELCRREAPVRRFGFGEAKKRRRRRQRRTKRQ
jgi:hypothetical protein